MTSRYTKALFLSLALLAGSAAWAQDFQWAKSVFAGPNSQFGSAEPRATALDQSGNVYAGIKNFGTADISGQIYASSDSAMTISLIKYDPQGNVSWVRRFGGVVNNPVELQDLETDAAGNVYALGYFLNQLTINGTLLNPGAGQTDYFIAKWNAAGTLLWAKSGGGTGMRFANALSIDAAGNIVIGGNFTSNSAFGPVMLTYSGNPGSNFRNAFCARLDSLGNVQWAVAPQGLPNAYTDVTSAGTDQAGNVYLTGDFQGTSVWGTTTLSFPSGSCAYWIKLNPAGTVTDYFMLNRPGTPKLAVDAAGYSYMSMAFTSAINLGGINFTASPGPNSFVAAYDPNGVLQWARHLTGGLSTQQGVSAYDLQLDNQGKLYGTGHFYGSVAVGGVSLTTTGNSAATYVAAFDQATGVPLWARKVTGPQHVLPAMLGANAAGQLSLIGEYRQGPLTLGSQTTSAGGPANSTASFVARLLQNYNSISGSIFLDTNGNGTRDAYESGFAGGIIEVSPGPLHTNSGSTGGYQANVGTGSFALSYPDPPLYHTVVASGPAAATFSGFGNVAAGPVYALRPVANQQDVRVLLTAITPARPGLTTSYRITYRNLGTVAIPSGSIGLQYDTKMTFLSSTQPAGQAGNTLTWAFSNLQPGQERHINVLFQLPTTLVVGDSLTSTATITPLSGDLNPADNTETAVVPVRASFDPNSIEVDYQHLTPAQVLAGQWLTYTIRFQNLGNDTAFSIMLRDTLPGQYLRPGTLQMLSASHDCLWSHDQGILTARFVNIKLPYQSINMIGSSGYVRFRIRPDQALMLGDIIRNKAYIYFDYNQPIVTNIATTVIQQPTAIPEAPSELTATAWPNPASEALQVEVQLPAPGPAGLRLLDATGRTVRQLNRTEPQRSFRTTLDVAGLPAGLYLLDLQTATSRFTRKITLR